MQSLMTKSGYKICVLSYGLDHYLLTFVPQKSDAVSIELDKNEMTTLSSLIGNSLNIQAINSEIP